MPWYDTFGTSHLLLGERHSYVIAEKSDGIPLGFVRVRTWPTYPLVRLGIRFVKGARSPGGGNMLLDLSFCRIALSVAGNHWFAKRQGTELITPSRATQL